MAKGSIGKSEGQRATEMHPPSPKTGHPLQERVHAPAPSGGKGC